MFRISFIDIRLLIFLFFSSLSVSVLTFKTPYPHTPSSLQFFAPRLKRTKAVSDGGLTFFPPHVVKSISVEWPDSLLLPFRIFWITCTALALASSWRDATDVLILPPLWRPYRHQTIGLRRNHRTLNIYRCIYYILKWYKFTMLFFHNTNNFLNLFYLKKMKTYLLTDCRCKSQICGRLISMKWRILLYRHNIYIR